MAFGGSAVGADNGMADFNWEQGNTKHIGSAKMLQQGGNPKQNLKQLGENERLTYIVGYKTTGGSKTTQKDTPDEIKFYLFDIDGNRKMYDVGENDAKATATLDGSQTKISATYIAKYFKPAATLDLKGLNEGMFGDHSSKIVADINDNLEKILSGFSDLKSNMDNYVLSYDNENERKIYSEQAILRYDSLLKMLADEASVNKYDRMMKRINDQIQGIAMTGIVGRKQIEQES